MVDGEIPNGHDAAYTEDSRYMVFFRGDDELGILGLTSGEVRYFPKVDLFKLPSDGGGRWVAYRLKDPARQLVLLDLTAGSTRNYPDVAEFQFSGNGQALLIQSRHGGDDQAASTLVWLSLATGRETRIAVDRVEEINHIVFDPTGAQGGYRRENECRSQKFLHPRLCIGE